jgi:hypothetical protein
MLIQILHAACTANQSDKKVLYNDINKQLLAPKPRLGSGAGEEKKNGEDNSGSGSMTVGGVVDPKSIDLSFRGGGSSGLEGGIEMTTKSVRASVLMDRKDSDDSDDDNDRQDEVTRMHAILDTPSHSPSLCHACLFPWQERLMHEMAEWRLKMKPNIEGATQELERPPQKKVATHGNAPQSASPSPTSTIPPTATATVATTTTSGGGVVGVSVSATTSDSSEIVAVPTGPVSAPKPLTTLMMGRAESVDIMGASSGSNGPPTTRIPSFSLSVPRGVALTPASAASSSSSSAQSSSGSLLSSSLSSTSSTPPSSLSSSSTTPSSLSSIPASNVSSSSTSPTSQQQTTIAPSADPNLPASLVAAAAVSITIAPSSRAHHTYCLCDQRRETLTLFSPRYGPNSTATTAAAGAAFVRITPKHVGAGFDLVRWRWFADIHQKAWGGDLVDDQLMRCLIER